MTTYGCHHLYPFPQRYDDTTCSDGDVLNFGLTSRRLFLEVIWGPGAWLEYGWLCSLCMFFFNGRFLGAFYMCWLMSFSVKRAENDHCGGIVDFSLREHYTSPGSWCVLGFWAKNPWRVEGGGCTRIWQSWHLTLRTLELGTTFVLTLAFGKCSTIHVQ